MSRKNYSETEGFVAWALSVFVSPVPGLHRLYLRKFTLGTLFFLIPGIGHFLSFFDVFSIRRFVREANLELEYKAALYGNSTLQRPEGPYASAGGRGGKRMSLEQVILQLARRNKGVVTPGEVALEAEIPIDEARKYLEKMVSGGHAEMRVRTSGAITFCFADFFDDAHEKSFEDI